jgi:hypothetical protein
MKVLPPAISPATAYGIDNFAPRVIAYTQTNSKQQTHLSPQTPSSISYKYSSKPTLTQTLASPKTQPFQATPTS